jgi:glycosyltransferase involved in cell wall biosynthesis
VNGTGLTHSLRPRLRKAATRLTRSLGLLLLKAANRRRTRRAEPPDMRRITILLLHAHGMGGTIRTVFNLAAILAADHDVEIVSVIKTKQRPFFPVPAGVRVTFLDDRTERSQRTARRAGAGRGSAVLGRIRAGAGRAPAVLGRIRAGAGRSLAVLGRSRLIPRQESAYSLFSLRTDLRLLRFLRGLRTGVLITTRPGLNLAAALLAPPGVITIGQEHTSLESHKSALRALILRRYGRLDALVTLTEADLRAYRAALGEHAPRHLLAIPNAAPPLTGGPAPLTGTTVLAIGRLVKVKGFDLLLQAWQQVQAAHPGWTLRLVGSGPERAQLQAAVQERGLTGSVQLPGATRDIAAELHGACLLAVSSRREGLPMAILEALSKGVPVVSFDCPSGPGEMITHGHDGLLVPAGDTGALATSISRLIQDQSLRHQMGERALRTARRYERAAIGRQWAALLSELSDDQRVHTHQRVHH